MIVSDSKNIVLNEAFPNSAGNKKRKEKGRRESLGGSILVRGMKKTGGCWREEHPKPHTEGRAENPY